MGKVGINTTDGTNGFCKFVETVKTLDLYTQETKEPKF
jgi:hypothetical protein